MANNLPSVANRLRAWWKHTVVCPAPSSSAQLVAVDLLKANLSPRQLQQFEDNDYFDVVDVNSF